MKNIREAIDLYLNIQTKKEREVLAYREIITSSVEIKVA
jgi:hypothetical protein